MLCQARARYLLHPPLFHDQSSMDWVSFDPCQVKRRFRGKFQTLPSSNPDGSPELGTQLCPLVVPAHAQPSQTLSTCSPVIRRLSKSSLHCTVVKIHETSFRGFQIRRLSIAKRYSSSATRFLITHCPAPLLRLHNCSRHPPPRNNHSADTFLP